MKNDLHCQKSRKSIKRAGRSHGMARSVATFACAAAVAFIPGLPALAADHNKMNLRRHKKIIPTSSHSSAAKFYRCLRCCGGLVLALAWLALSAAKAQTTNYALGTTNLLVGPAAGTNSVVLGVTPINGAWTATANAPWLHLSAANQSGTGSTNVVFNFDANPGAMRSGAITIADRTLAVTQAGSTYVAAGPVTTLVSAGLNGPIGVAVDRAGNVYIADTFHGAIKKWTAANNNVLTLVSSGLIIPEDVAVDNTGNVYIADSNNNAIKEWMPANSNVTTLVSSGLSNPASVAVDSAGNAFIAELGAIKEWTAANNTVVTLISSLQLYPMGIAVDAAGNVYFADVGNDAIKEWMAANSNVTTLVSSGLRGPNGIAVDGAGNVYIADLGNNSVKEWTAAGGILSTLVSSGLSYPAGVAVDGVGNVYIANTDNDAIEELPRAFVDPTPKFEGLAAGSDALPGVLPATENLLPPFAPASDQSWLNITGITNGVVSFSFTANTGPARTAHIALLGQSISNTQGVIGTPPSLTGAQVLGNGVFQFAFTNTPGASFTVLSTTNLSLPLSDWTVAGPATNTAPEVFQFTSPPATNEAQLFYTVRSP